MARLVMPGFESSQGAFTITAAYSSPEGQVSLGDKDNRRYIQHTTIGGVINYRFQQITQSEPDPTLFQVPSGYTRKLEHTPVFEARIVSGPPPKVIMVRPPPPRRRFGSVPCEGRAPPQAVGCLGEISP